jgi:hypothetical protein
MISRDVGYNNHLSTKRCACSHSTDCHFRVGGAKGTNLQVAQCPSRTAVVIASCVAASTMMVVAPNSNGYVSSPYILFTQSLAIVDTIF